MEANSMLLQSTVFDTHLIALEPLQELLDEQPPNVFPVALLTVSSRSGPEWRQGHEK
jgi:hypothetical protein